MNNNDQPQSANDMYRVPTTLSETISFDIETPEQPEAQIERQFHDIAREEVRLSFEEMTKALALSADGIEPPNRTIETVEFEANPHAVEILEMSNAITEFRTLHHAELAALRERKRLIRKMITALFGDNSSPATRPGSSKQATIEYLAEFEDAIVGQKTFPIDSKIEPEVKSRRFIFLPDGNEVVWYMQQTATDKTKNFTNSYKVRPHVVEKSSTYFDANLGRERNTAVVAADDEILTLKAAVTHYHGEVMKNIYTKPVTTKKRTKSSGPRGRTK